MNYFRSEIVLIECTMYENPVGFRVNLIVRDIFTVLAETNTSKKDIALHVCEVRVAFLTV